MLNITGNGIEIIMLTKLLKIQMQVLSLEVPLTIIVSNEPKKIDESLLNPERIVSMQEELNQLKEIKFRNLFLHQRIEP